MIKKISRIFFLALTLLSLVALGVFLVQLIVVNSGRETEEPDSVVSGGSSNQDEASPDTGEVGETPEATVYVPPPTERPPPQGQRREITVDSGSNTVLVIYSEDEKFDYVENDLDWRFEYKGSGNAALEIGFLFLSPKGVAADSEAFLNSKIDGNTAEYKGQQPIIDSPMEGYSVQAKSGGITYEAWIYRLPGTDLALTFLVNFEFDGQRDDLYTVLSSMSIE